MPRKEGQVASGAETPHLQLLSTQQGTKAGERGGGNGKVGWDWGLEEGSLLARHSRGGPGGPSGRPAGPRACLLLSISAEVALRGTDTAGDCSPPHPDPRHWLLLPDALYFSVSDPQLCPPLSWLCTPSLWPPCSPCILSPTHSVSLHLPSVLPPLLIPVSAFIRPPRSRPQPTVSCPLSPDPLRRLSSPREPAEPGSG